jgi:hypothetical protein
VASHPLIEAHLSTLRGRLPADAVDELADGLIETYHHHLAEDADPYTAACCSTSRPWPPRPPAAVITGVPGPPRSAASA